MDDNDAEEDQPNRITPAIKAAAPVETPRRAAAGPQRRDPVAEPAEVKGRTCDPAEAVKPRFDRVAYQRAYMRKRRAKAR